MWEALFTHLFVRPDMPMPRVPRGWAMALAVPMLARWFQNALVVTFRAGVVQGFFAGLSVASVIILGLSRRRGK